MDIKLRMGITVTGEEAIKTDLAMKNFKMVKDKLNKLNVDIVSFDEALSTDSVSKKAGRFFSENNIDVLLVVAGTWAYDNYIVNTTKFLECPVIYWSPPEKFGVPFPEAGSLVGAIQNCGVLNKLGKKVKIIMDEINGYEGFNKLDNYVKVLTAIKNLSFSNVGLIGGRCPGMLDTSFHELELRNQIGPDIIHIFISNIIKEVNKVKDSDATKVLNHLINKNQKKNVDEATLLESIKIYMVTKKYAEDYNLDAIAFRCWPDLKDNNICSPCFTLSQIADEGIMSACEGDVTAAVSMLILNYLTGNNVYLGDLLKIDVSTNIAYYFHCGAMPSNLAENKTDIEYAKHSSPHVWKQGLTVEFPMKPGRVTFARVGEIRSKYRILSYTGEAVESDMFVRGNPAKVKLDKSPEYIVESLINNGSEHHQIAVHGDVVNKLKLFCEFLNLDYVLL